MIHRPLGALGLGAVLTAALTIVPHVRAQDKGAPTGQENRVTMEQNETIATFLKRLEGKAVRLRLAGGGDELGGKVAKVGDSVVYLSDLSGRDFYDAVVRLDQIAAVVVQTRGR